MVVGVPRDNTAGEQRVAITPMVVPSLQQAGLTVLVESGSGQAAGFPDRAYEEKGAQIVSSRADLFAKAEVILQVRALGANPSYRETDLPYLRSNQVVIGLMNPLVATEALQEASTRGITALALELTPRTGRAQQMDVLSSMATVAGYKAVLLAAVKLPKMFPLLMTAGGTVSPAHVFVLGVGVAGLQAIATARRLGAVVQAYDVRPTVATQVESLGAKFVQLPLETQASEDTWGYAKAVSDDMQHRQQELLAKVVAGSDVVISAAVVPGQKAPTLITEQMVAGMQPGSVIVDLAAEQGGNCALTRANEDVIHRGVTILGPTNLPASVPYHASQMFAKNMTTFVRHLFKNGTLQLDANDDIVQETLVIHGGSVVHPKLRDKLGLAPLQVK